MKRPLTALLAIIVLAGGAPAAANLIDGKPYTALPECPNVRQYAGLVNDYKKKKQTGQNVLRLIDRLTALGDAYHGCARGFEVTRITDSDKADAAQHHIAAESAIAYTEAVVNLAAIFETIPKAQWKPLEPTFVEAAHLAMVDAKYVLDRSDDDVDKQHAKKVADAITRAARRYMPKRYDEIVELRPDDIREH